MIFYISFASLLLTLHKRSSRFCTSTFCTSKVYKTDISLSRNFEEKKWRVCRGLAPGAACWEGGREG